MDNSIRFYLLENGQSAKVRFLMNTWNEVELTHTHDIQVSKDNFRRIRCLGDNCIACKRGYPLTTRVYIPLFNEELNTVQYWERTSASHYLYFDAIFKRFKKIPYMTFEITRHGYKGDIHTTYEITPIKENKELSVCDNAKDPDGNLYEVVDENVMMDYITSEENIRNRIEVPEND